MTKLFPLVSREAYVYDPSSYIAQRPDTTLGRRSFDEHPRGEWDIRFNDVGTRDAEDLRQDRPELRIVVTGDSHTAGVVPFEESFANVIEARLRSAGRDAEVLNAGLGGANPYNYLGVLEAFRSVEPDVFVVCIYGGNDFSGALQLQRFFERRGPPNLKEPISFRWIAELRDSRLKGAIAQELSQAAYFLDNPEDEQVAIDTTASILARMARLCAEDGIELVTIYLPPPFRVQPEHYLVQEEGALAVLGLSRGDLAVSEHIADSALAWARKAGLNVLDLREVFTGHGEPLYWFTDLHLNTRGHELVADVLRPVVERLAE